MHTALKQLRKVWRVGAVVAVLAAGASAAETAPTTRPVTSAPGDVVASGLDENGSITLAIGKTRLISTRSTLETVDSTQPEIAFAKVIPPSDVTITGRKPGTAQLMLWDDKGRSQTIDITVQADVQGLTATMKRLFPDARIEAGVVEGQVILRGHVPNAEIAKQAEAAAAPYGSKVLNFLEISGGRQVTLQVRFAEVSRAATTNLGFNAFATGGPTKLGWNNGPGATPIGGLSANNPNVTIDPSVAVFGAGSAGVFNFEFFIQALRQNNLLRVLAEPNLTVISGKQASFLAGGEFPIPVPQSSGAGGSGTAITVEYKQFGVRLNFTPVVLGDGRVRLQVTPEVSDLDFTRSVSFNGFVIPSLTKRTLDTVVELNEGQTLALAGLLDHRITANKNVTPLLGDLPVLGVLFRSVQYTRNETELVVLVTPRFSEGMNPGQVPTLPGEYWRYPTEGELFWLRDLGGPAAETAKAPSPDAPPMFHGTYGFAPATAAGAAHGK